MQTLLLTSLISLPVSHQVIAGAVSCDISGDDEVAMVYRQVHANDLLAGAEEARPAHCLVSVAEAHRLIAQKKSMLIDIRSADDFERVSIPGSVNMLGYSLKTKVYLRDKSIILAGEGHSYGGHERLCEELKQSGYLDVRILEGGLRAWQDSVGKLLGDDEAIQALSRMTPLDFEKERQYSHWHVLQLSERLLGEQAGIWEQMVMHRLNTERQRQLLNKATDFVLVTTPDGASYLEIERLRQLTELKNVFYLEGGLSGVDAYEKQQFALLHRRENKVGRKSPCDYL